MLVLHRKAYQTIKIGDRITITVLKSRGRGTKIGIDAPPEMNIVRGELKGTEPRDAKKDR